MMPDRDEAREPFDGVPENMQSLVREVDFLDELADPQIEAMYAPVREGYCMTCHTELGVDTAALVNKHGIVAMYCSGACAQDLVVMGWLQEQWDDAKQRVEFRGGNSYPT